MSPRTRTNIFKYFSIAAGFFCFLPILCAYQDIWDGSKAHVAFRVQDMDILKSWFFESRWTLQYYYYLLFEFLQNLTGISYKIFANITASFALTGICVEVYRLLAEELRLDKEYVWLGILSLLVLPPWATLMSSVLTFHILCVWLFMLSTRWYRSRPFLALPLFMVSLSLNSIFAFAVGYALFLGIMRLDENNWKRLLVRIFFFSLILLVIFVAYRHFFPPYGRFLNYNSFNPRLSSFGNYLGVAAIILVLTWFFTGKQDNESNQKVLWRNVSGCLILLFFAGVAYWAVNKPIKLEGTNSFTPRHAFLSAIPVSMLIATLACGAVKRMGRIVPYALIGALLTLSFCYQFAAFQQKYTELYYENALIKTLREMNPPAPGAVVIASSRKTIPKYLRSFSTVGSWMFLDAYGTRQWSCTFCAEGRNCPEPARLASNRPPLRTWPEVPQENLRATMLAYSVNDFDPFGNPLYYYYYFAREYDRLTPRLEVLSVEPY
jgi:hypothetical protein